MKTLVRFVAFAAAMSCMAISFAQTKSPSEILKAISEYRTELLGPGPLIIGSYDPDAIDRKLTAKANELLEGVDPAKVDAKQAYLWAQVFSTAERHRETCDLIRKYLSSDPSAQSRYTAQMLMLSACNELGEGEMIAETLRDVKVPNAFMSQAFLRTVASTYVNAIAEDLGLDEAFKALDDAYSQLELNDPEEYAARQFESSKKRGMKNSDGSLMSDEQIMASLIKSVKTGNANFPYLIASTKANLLANNDRSQEALTFWKDYKSTLEEDSRFIRNVDGAISVLDMIGKPSSALKFDHQYGDFTSLADWKGKVVVIDFTAHW